MALDTGYQSLQANGTEIFYRADLPEKPKGIVLISHGYGGHSGQYQHFMDFLSRNGYGVYAYDHRGHGRSRTPKGHLERYELLIEDMSALVQMIKRTHPGVPLFTFGHSMGGFVAFAYGLLQPQTLSGQIFSAPALGMPWGTGWIPEFLFELLGTHLGQLRVYHLVKRQAARDEGFRRALRTDPLALKFATVRFFYEFIHRGIRWVQQNADKYTLPCLFLHGRADKIIPYATSQTVMQQISSTDKTLKLYECLYHELLQEPERDMLMQDILQWLEQFLERS